MCCQESLGCQRPEKLEGKPEECSGERIRECHGEIEKQTRNLAPGSQ
jgi:hypothetical protein